jgi:hypothetical protein
VQVLKKICWYAVLAPKYSTDEGSSSDVTTLITTTAAYKQMGDLPLHKQLLSTFTNPGAAASLLKHAAATWCPAFLLGRSLMGSADAAASWQNPVLVALFAG